MHSFLIPARRHRTSWTTGGAGLALGSALRRAIALLLATTSIGCAWLRSGDGSELQARGVLLVVSNNTPEDQPVYLIAGSVEFQVGRVSSFSSRTFVISKGQVAPNAEYRMASHKHGSREGFKSEPFSLALGNVVYWTIDSARAPTAEVRSFGGHP